MWINVNTYDAESYLDYMLSFIIKEYFHPLIFVIITISL